MPLRDTLRRYARDLLGVSAYETRPPVGNALDSDIVEEIRQALGGQLQPLPSTRLRWYLADLEHARHSADAGNLTQAARLCNAMRQDGVLQGLLNTRCDGLVRMPKRFYGNDETCERLRSHNGSRSVFDEAAPPGELATIDKDGIDLGVGIGELVPVSSREYPVLVRLDPEFLQYRWVENRWYYASVAGLLPVTPGDGRWVLHIPGARIAPWRYGQWPALGRNFINKDHALQHRSNFSAKLANPARVAEAPIGATEPERKGMLQKLMAWAVNTVFVMPPGWQAKILETNGRGWEVFQQEIDACNKEFMILIAGQEVTTTGGTGFSNQQMPEMIRQDLIQADAEKLAYTVNTQIIPLLSVLTLGDRGLVEPSWLEWATGRAKELENEGRTLQTAADGLTKLVDALAKLGLANQIDVPQLLEHFGIPLLKGTPNISDAAGTKMLPRVTNEPTPEGAARAEQVIDEAA